MFSKSHHGKKILIIESDFVAREALSMVLAAEGYMVPAAAHSKEALEMLHAPERPDLILLDSALSERDSRELQQRLKQDPQLASIPIIILAAEASDAQIADSWGAIDRVEKPVDTHHLLEKINSRFLAVSLS